MLLNYSERIVLDRGREFEHLKELGWDFATTRTCYIVLYHKAGADAAGAGAAAGAVSSSVAAAPGAPLCLQWPAVGARPLAAAHRDLLLLQRRELLPTRSTLTAQAIATKSSQFCRRSEAWVVVLLLPQQRV